MSLKMLIIISLAAKCSSLPPTYPKQLKPVPPSYSQKLVSENHPSLKGGHYTPKPYAELINTDKQDLNPLKYDEGIQYAPLPLKREETQKMKANTQTTTQTSLEEGNEELDQLAEPPLSYSNTHLEPTLNSFKGPNIYNNFNPRHEVQNYPNQNSYPIINSLLAMQKANQFQSKVYGQFGMYEKNPEDKLKMPTGQNLAFYYSVPFQNSKGEQFETEPPEQPAPPRTKLHQVQINIAKDFKSSQLSYQAPPAALLRLLRRPIRVLIPALQEHKVTRLRPASTYVSRS